VKDIWHLHRIDWMRELSVEEIEKLRSASVRLDVAHGHTIFAPESHPHSLYLLECGLARIYRLSESGAETSFGYVAPGEVFGELAAFGDYPRENFAVAVRDSLVWKIPASVFQALLGQRPDLVIEVTRQIGERLKRIESRLENLVFRDVRSRVAHILLELAEDFGREDGGGIELDVEFTQAELATLVGSTRQTVNASLRELETDGAIGRHGRHVVLIQLQKVRRMAASTPTP
jgi:CRP-like cAMP-binding protein